MFYLYSIKMPTVKCNILRKGKDIKTVFIQDTKRDFEINNSVYLIPNEMCLITINTKNQILRNPQLFYSEGNPYPIGTNPKLIKMTSTLDGKILENFLSQSGSNNGLNLFGFLGKIGWKNFFIGMVAVTIIYIIITQVF